MRVVVFLKLKSALLGESSADKYNLFKNGLKRIIRAKEKVSKKKKKMHTCPFDYKF